MYEVAPAIMAYMTNPQTFMEFGQEVVTVIAEGNRKRGLYLSSFPMLTDNGFGRRMDDTQSGRGKGSVNFASMVKKYVRANFSGFKFQKKFRDELIFEKKISEDTNLLFVFEKVRNQGLGKTFSVMVGCELSGGTEPIWWRQSLLQFFDREELEWIYGPETELLECLHEVYILLNSVVEQFEALLLEFVEKPETSVLENRPEQGAVSFHEAAEIAHRFALQVGRGFDYIDGAWYRAHNTWRFSDGKRRVIPCDRFSGRLGPGQTWLVRFVDLLAHRTVTVGVPYRGRLTARLSNSHTAQQEGIGRMLKAPPDPKEAISVPEIVSDPGEGRTSRKAFWKNFEDSTKAFEAAKAAGYDKFQHHHPKCTANLSLYATITEPPNESEFWMFEANNSLGTDHRHWSCRIGARDLQVTEVNDR